MKNAATAKAVDLGTKRHCPKCAAKFYDFNKSEIECPKCGTEVDPNAVQTVFPKAAPVKRAKPEEEDETPADRADDVAGSSFEDLDDLSDAEVVPDVETDDDEDE